MSCSCSASKISPGFAERQTSSASVSAARPSPSAMRTSDARASSSSGSGSPRDLLGPREELFDRRPRRADLKISTRARERSAAFSSKDGFSVVAPTSVTVPSSMTGRKASSWARLKRWISSTKSSVPCPVARRPRAASNTFFRSATPEKIAEICSKWRSVSLRQQPRHRGLAGAGRPPEDQRAERARTRAAASARRPARPDGPGRRPRTAWSGAAGRPAGAAPSWSRPAAAKRSDTRVRLPGKGRQSGAVVTPSTVVNTCPPRLIGDLPQCRGCCARSCAQHPWMRSRARR